jgi:hypothetical protein
VGLSLHKHSITCTSSEQTSSLLRVSNLRTSRGLWCVAVSADRKLIGWGVNT